MINKMKISLSYKNIIVFMLQQVFLIALSIENLGVHYFQRPQYSEDSCLSVYEVYLDSRDK